MGEETTGDGARDLAHAEYASALRRLEEAGLLRSRWEAVETARSEQRPPRRYYTVTGSGTQAVRDAMDRYPTLERAFDQPARSPEPRTA